LSIRKVKNKSVTKLSRFSDEPNGTNESAQKTMIFELKRERRERGL
jgi:hypothetical protein